MHRGYARSPLGISTIFSSASFLLLGVRSWVANIGLQRRPFEAEFLSMHAVATRIHKLRTDQYHPTSNANLGLTLTNLSLDLASGTNLKSIMHP